MTDSNEHNNSHHILPLGTYLLIGSTLLVLTAFTVYVSFFHFGEWNLIVAMAIAASKATLVALYFMHLKYDKKIFSIVFIGALLFLAIFISFTMLDTMKRDDLYELRAIPVKPEAIIYDKTATTPDSTAAIDSTGVVDSTAAGAGETHEGSGH